MSRIYRIFLAFAVLAILTESSFTQGKKDKAPGRINAYSISATALKGQSATDLCVAIQTVDAMNYPIPGNLKKLQVKVLKETGGVVYIRNISDVPVVAGSACVSIENLSPMMKVEVQVHIKTSNTVDEEVLRAYTSVFLRPDLSVKEVIAPAQVPPNAPFSIEGTIQETNMQAGATATVSLCEGATVLATASGVTVNPGGQVSVLFQGFSLPDTGIHNLTLKISDAVPGEYNTANNDYPFSIFVGELPQPVSYWLSYYVYRNRTYTSTYTYCGEGSTTTLEGGAGSWNYQANIPFALQAPIDSVRLEAISGNGTLTRAFIAGWNPYFSDASSDYYDGYVEDADGSQTWMNLYVYKNYGYSYFYAAKSAGDYLYIINATNGSSWVQELNSQQMNLDDFLDVRILISDGGQNFGGSAVIDVVYTPEQSSWNNSYDNGYCMIFDFGSDSYEWSSNSSSGTTDPTLLPSGRARDKDLLLASGVTPLNADMVQNYPNPFNPSTNVQFTVEKSGPAVLKVYDMLGKEVAELFQGEATEGRTYRFSFNAANFASGMYYAKLEAGGKQYVKKMLLMK